MSPHPDQAPLVLFVAFPQMGLLDLTGPQSAFWVASKNLRKAGHPGYDRHTVSQHGGGLLGLEHLLRHRHPDQEGLRQAVQGRRSGQLER